MRSSLILQVPRETVLPLRKSLFKITGGDGKEAVLLCILAEWIDHEYLEQKVRSRRNEDRTYDGRAPLEENRELWVRRTPEELAQDSMGLLSSGDVMQKARSLQDKGLVVIDRPFRDEGDDREFIRLDLLAINDALREIISGGVRKAETRHRRVSDQIASARRGEYKNRYAHDSWQYVWSSRWWDRMEELERIKEPWRSRKEEVLQDWSDAFDKCIRTRGFEKKDVALVLKWLFQWNDFWIPQGNIQAPTKFNKRLSNGEWCIVHMVKKARIAREDRLSLLPEEDETVTTWQMENKIVPQFGEGVRDYFQSAGYGTGRNSDEKVYKLTVPRDKIV